MNARRERRTLWWALVASFFVHVIVALSLASFNGAFAPAPVTEDKPVELAMVDLSATPPPVPKNPAFVETEKESAEEPKEKTFESNANSIAASKQPATGDAPVPGQEGKEQPFMDLQTQDYALNSQGAPPQPTPPPAKPIATPARSTPAPTSTPKASATATATPLPTAPSEPEQLAMLKATPPPAMREPQDSIAVPAEDLPPTPPPAPTARPQPQRPSSAYQPQKEQTHMTGRITNRGPSAVDAVGTPLGKFQKKVSDAIGARWYFYMNDRIDLVSVGTAHLEAEVDRAGKVQNLRVLSNNANEAFANICLQSFQEAQIPPIPPDLVATLPDGKLAVDIFFTTYPSR